MKLQCKHCGVIFKRDMRSKMSRKLMTKRGYRTYCDKFQKNCFANKVKDSE